MRATSNTYLRKAFLLSVYCVLAAGVCATPTASYAAALSDTQLQAIESLLTSFGVNPTTIATVHSALTGDIVSSPYSGSASGGTGSSQGLRVPYCLDLSANLGSGATDATSGGAVTKLQQWLSDNGLYQGPVTGYFGSLTQAAVQKFQSAQGITSSGSPETTGYGTVGPSTRALFRSWCDRATPQPSSTGSSSSSSESTDATALPTITIDSSSLTSDSATPTLSGTAANVSAVMVSVTQGDVARFGSGIISVSNGVWSVTVPALSSGSYSVTVRSARGNAVVTGSLVILSGASSSTTNTSVVPSGSTSEPSTPSATTPSPTVTVRANGSANGAAVVSGGSAYIGWSSTNATSCTISSSPASSLSGSTGISAIALSTGTLSQTTVFTVSCAGAGGSGSGSVTVSVGTSRTSSGGVVNPPYTNPVLPIGGGSSYGGAF